MIRYIYASLLIVSLFVAACSSSPDEESVAESDFSSEASSTTASTAEPGVVVIRAEDFAFHAPASFPSGWVRLRFENAGAETHFLYLMKLPEGRSFDDYYAEVSTPFSEYYALYSAGEISKAELFEQLIATIPEWFYSAIPMGGPGFTAPGRTSEVMVYLDPAENYVLECYVRAMEESHRFHGEMGMLRPMVVGPEVSPLAPPVAYLEITLSSFNIAVEGEPSVGEQHVRVKVEDTPEGFIRHNVHLVKLNEDQNAAEVAAWLDWVDAMLPPAPAEFLGGAGQTVAGRESYLTINLEPGRYAWVSEAFGVQGMLHEFTVE